MNVHPAKTEVRFRDLGRIKAHIIQSVRACLATAQGTSSQLTAHFGALAGRPAFHGAISATEASASPVAYKTPCPAPSCEFMEGVRVQDLAFWPSAASNPSNSANSANSSNSTISASISRQGALESIESLDIPGKTPQNSAYNPLQTPSNHVPFPASFPAFPSTPSSPVSLNLGLPKAQIFDSFIVSQSENSFFIIDQHAAHERLMYEHFQKNLTLDPQTGWILFTGSRQKLLFPLHLPLTDSEALMAEDLSQTLTKMGWENRPVSDPSPILLITSSPKILEGHDQALLSQILREITSSTEPSALLARLHHLFATTACHNSIRANHPLSHSEMAELLRQIEKTERSSQCNHGRPVFVQFSRTDLERLFERHG